MQKNQQETPLRYSSKNVRLYNVFVTATFDTSVSGCNLSVYDVIKAYLSMYISVLVTIVQALLGLGSDGHV